MTRNATAVLFGSLVKRERESMGWSFRHLARLSGVAASHICRIEQGENASLGHAVRLASALAISLDDLRAPECETCHGAPPEGFTCNRCGRGGGS